MLIGRVFDDPHQVARLGLTFGVMDHHVRVTPHQLLVEAVLLGALDRHHHRLIHLVANDATGTDLSVALPSLGLYFGPILLGHNGFDAGNIAPHLVNAPVVLQLACGQLEAEVEQLLMSVPQLLIICPRGSSAASRYSSAPALSSSSLCTNFALKRQLVPGKTHGLFSDIRRDATQLKDDAARFDDGYPVVRCALTGTHTGFGRLGRDRLVRKDPNPDLATTLDMVRDDAAGGFNLLAGQPRALERLETIIAEVDRTATIGQSAPLTAMLLAMLNSGR